ncbi:MAG: mutL [Chlamydiales bacterium]|jgi:DNA mismatch repair protein MutL|nr:mutL [Chlamydiales bacterium]
MSKIRVLDPGEINKIAAGEVVENPGSVVKELVDNALDAGASEITVEIQGGGRNLIRVSDNGSGMSLDDALLSLERHATSKIRTMEDIYRIGTMGFRGEAIPSIASVSKFSILTAIDSTESSFSKPIKGGNLILVEGGKILKTSEAPRSPGTTVEVRSLFYNVPVRMQFLKSPAFDASDIHRYVMLAALAHPNVRFSLINNGKLELDLPAMPEGAPLEQGYQTRMISLLGPEWKEALSIQKELPDIQLLGWIGRPSQFRSNRKGQYLFINRRPVFSKEIAAIIKEAYGSALPMDKYPLFFLMVTMQGHLFDVNVHPQKREVRLRREGIVRQFLMEAVDQALSFRAPASTSASAIEARPNEGLPKESDALKSLEAPQAPISAFTGAGVEEPNFSRFAAFKAFDRFRRDESDLLPKIEQVGPSGSPKAGQPIGQVRPFGQARHEGGHEGGQAPLVRRQSMEPAESAPRLFTHEPLEFVGVYKGWLFVKGRDLHLSGLPEEGLFVVDLKKGAMRIAYDKYLGQLENLLHQTASQKLLFPLSIQLSQLEINTLEHLFPSLAKLGLQLEKAKDALAVHTLPEFLKEGQVQPFLIELASELISEMGSEANREEQLKGHLKQALQAVALKASRYFAEQEVTSPMLLLKQLLKSKEPTFTPSGRRIIAPFDDAVLKNLF